MHHTKHPMLAMGSSSAAASMRTPPVGPYTTADIRPGDPYELSNGYKIECSPAGTRHAKSNQAGAEVLHVDPGNKLDTVCDVGCALDATHLRAPDIALGAFGDGPGWAKGAPVLAIEYADRGQDEDNLQTKIAELLDAGTLQVWVFRYDPIRGEVYERGTRRRDYAADEPIPPPPGVLANSYTPRQLTDPQAARATVKRNVLQQAGYESLEQVREEGELRGKAQAVLAVLAARGLVVGENVQRAILQCRHGGQLDEWLKKAAIVDAAEKLL